MDTPMTDFHRIKRLPPYVFEQVNRIKAQPAPTAPTSSISAWATRISTPRSTSSPSWCETAGRPRTDRYSASKGIAGLRRAQAGYYQRRFGVSLNPDTQVVATLGSKEGFANMAQAITAPGDVVLVPNPSYPIHAFGFLMAGGVIRSVPAEPTPAFFPARREGDAALDPEAGGARGLLSRRTPPPTWRASISTGTSSPSRSSTRSSSCRTSPTRRSISTATRRPPCCRCPGAIDCTVEFTSLSKTFSMAGWRMGFAVGNERLLAALTRVKSYLDYGAFTPIQVAATAALNGPDDCIVEMRGDLQEAPRRAGRILRQGRLEDPDARSLDVRLGADPGEATGSWAASNSPSCCWRSPTWRWRPASASASTATSTSASRSSRTSSASGRLRATSAASSTRRGQDPAQRRADGAGRLSRTRRDCCGGATRAAKGVAIPPRRLSARTLDGAGSGAGVVPASRGSACAA